MTEVIPYEIKDASKNETVPVEEKLTRVTSKPGISYGNVSVLLFLIGIK